MATKALSSPYGKEFAARMDLLGAHAFFDVDCGPGTIGLAVAGPLPGVVGWNYSAAMHVFLSCGDAGEYLFDSRTMLAPTKR